MKNPFSRFISQHRALPLETLNATWLAENGASQGNKQARPGQLIPAAVDQFGIPYARLITTGADGYPTTTRTNWVLLNTTAGARATATRAAVAGVRHVCTAISVGYTSNAGGAAIGQLRDGASLVGAILWENVVSNQPVAALDAKNLQFSGLDIQGTAGNAMTIEFGAVGAGVYFQFVNAYGYDIPA